MHASQQSCFVFKNILPILRYRLLSTELEEEEEEEEKLSMRFLFLCKFSRVESSLYTSVKTFSLKY